MFLNRSYNLGYNVDENERRLWWQKLSIMIVIHKVNCVNDKCECKLGYKGKNGLNESQLILEDLKKMMVKMV